jgi:hypothetical protein
VDKSISNAKREIGERCIVEVVFIDGTCGWRHGWKQQYLLPLYWLERDVVVYKGEG